MLYKVTAPQKLNATIHLPASKSISNRALIIHALAGGGPLPENLSDCDDTQVVISALREMPPVIDIKAAGTAMRFLTAYLAVTPGTHVITGTERMKHRPIGPLVDALRRLGADISYEGEEGYPPLRISGRQLEGRQIEMDGSVSSQYISALLLIAPATRNGLELTLTGDVISRPYIDLTLCTMRDFGADVEWTDNNTITVRPKPYRQRPYWIESDWSAASYWYEAVALSGDAEAEVRLEGLMDGSVQGDSGVRYLFNMLGVKTVFGTKQRGTPTTVTITKPTAGLQRLDYDFINQPDMAQTFVACCAARGIQFGFTGLSTLRIKETDRMEALVTEMRKAGYVLQPTGSTLTWKGGRCEPQPSLIIDTYNDHRMAMAFAMLALSMGSIGINDPGVVSKSYPNFWNDMRQAGFTITQL